MLTKFRSSFKKVNIKQLFNIQRYYNATAQDSYQKQDFRGQAKPELNNSYQEKQGFNNQQKLGIFTSVMFGIGIFDYQFNKQAIQKSIQKSVNQIITDSIGPPSKKLLFDQIQMPGMGAPGKTVVFNVTGTILESSYIMGKGRDLQKRKGLDNLLNKLAGSGVEIVFFSNEDLQFVQLVSTKLDPRRMKIPHLLGNECFVLDNWEWKKDLSYLNRDLKNIIVIETQGQSTTIQNENVIHLKKFNQNDESLVDLLPLLTYLTRKDVKDIRKELKKLGDNPLEQFNEQLKKQKEYIDKSFFGRKQQNQGFKKFQNI